MNIKELYKYCQDEILNGNGNKEIYISTDEEGNGFHKMYYAFTSNRELIEKFASYGTFDISSEDSIEDVILLG